MISAHIIIIINIAIIQLKSMKPKITLI